MLPLICVLGHMKYDYGCIRFFFTRAAISAACLILGDNINVR